MYKWLLGIGICSISFLGLNQTGNVSPYSAYGIGNMRVHSDAVETALGYSGFAIVDSAYLNFKNPSSYSRIASGYPLFSLGLTGNLTKFSNGTSSFNKGHIYIDHFVLAFPFKKRFGLAFGLTPFAKRNYHFATSQGVDDSDTLNYEYNGLGTISKSFVGLSFDPIHFKKFRWSLGANMGYLFGRTDNQRISILNGTNSGGIHHASRRLAGIHTEFASTMSFEITSKFSGVLTAIYEPEQKWKTIFGEELYYSTNVQFTDLYQKLDSSFVTGQTSYAGSYGLGLTIEQKIQRTTRKNKEVVSRLQYTLAYQKVAYSQMKEIRDNVAGAPLYSHDLTHASFGLAYTPDKDFYNNNLTGEFFKRLTYRAGFYSGMLPYTKNNTAYKQFGTTFGIGIPVLSQFSYSSVNIGVDFGQRTNSVAGSLTEKYMGLKFGVILSPSRADSWFRKVKLD